MLGGSFDTTIQASPEKVWAVVADVGTHASWSPKHYEMRWSGGEPNQIGSTFHSVGSIPENKHNENDVEITSGSSRPGSHSVPTTPKAFS